VNLLQALVKPKVKHCCETLARGKTENFMAFNYSAFILSHSLTSQLLRGIPDDAGFLRDVTTELGAAIKEKYCRWLGSQKQIIRNRQDKLGVENIVD